MNNERLKNKINENGLKLSFIAEQLELSYYGLQLKLNGKSDFKWSEIVKLNKILNLTEKDRDLIFFNNKGDFK